jgi:hypothetical protein
LREGAPRRARGFRRGGAQAPAPSISGTGRNTDGAGYVGGRSRVTAPTTRSSIGEQLLERLTACRRHLGVVIQ